MTVTARITAARPRTVYGVTLRVVVGVPASHAANDSISEIDVLNCSRRDQGRLNRGIGTPEVGD
jgi:hypothetical protein